MLYFTKILNYDLHPADKNKFDYAVGVLNQTIDPPSLKPGMLAPVKGLVFFSPLRRAWECLSVLSDRRYESVAYLCEVPFELSSGCSAEEYEQEGSIAVRRCFLDLYLADQLNASRAQLWNEIKMILQYCQREAQYGDVTVVSHSFRLKLIESFIRSHGRIENAPGLLKEFIKIESKTYPFGGGFSVNENDISTFV